MNYDSLDIVIPVYNEAATIAETLHEIGEKLHMPFRVHVVYDHEEDSTLPIVREKFRENPNMQLRYIYEHSPWAEQSYLRYPVYRMNRN